MRDLMADNFVWLPEKGVGYFPVKAFPYDEDYFANYEDYASNAVGEKITQARIDFVAEHYEGELVDVGIGCGQFVEMHGNCQGFDVNPVGIEWLKQRDLWRDMYEGCDALTFWDSLEHIKDIACAVAQARKFVFVTIPIYLDCYHVLQSKHFKKDEHYWYFTHEGLVAWFDEQGFDLVAHNAMERDFGREDVDTFAFRRR